jgi:predicted TIM-barrel fold metal-dependent hydrolase
MRLRSSVPLTIAALLLAIVILLSLPIADWVAQLQQNDVARALLSRKRLTLAIVGALGIAIAAWLVLRRHFRILGACVAAGVLAALALVVLVFQQTFPRAELFSVERYRESAALLLGTDALLSHYEPRATLVLDSKQVLRPAYPAIDVHFHLESMPTSITPERLVASMDAAGVAKLVNLGGWPPEMFEHFAETFYAKYPDRFIMFAKPDPGALGYPNGVAEQLEWIKKAARMGARGLKENKSFGLGQEDADGKLVPVDDERLAPIWELAGQLGMPVLVHTGEPASFWQPIDVHNERYAELLANPNWSLDWPGVPTLQELMAQRERLLARHPRTNFIGAHFGMNPDNLKYAGYLLDTYPNYYVDMSSVVQELGRQPYSAREFFIRYQDRILFGTDGGFGLAADGDGWTPERMYRSHFEFLETKNEYIEYPMFGITKQGNWHVYGIDLPDDVLEKIYVTNAERLIPSSESINACLLQLEAGGRSVAPAAAPDEAAEEDAGSVCTGR